MTGKGDLAAGADSFARDWRAVRADADIQFAPLAMPRPPETPAWLKALNEWLQWLLGPVGRWLGGWGPAVPWIAGAIAAVLALYVLWRLRAPIARWLGRTRPPAPEPAWQPDPTAALALLEDADRLAEEGRYDEAARLLLQRSVGHIVEARPGLLEPSSTAREIAVLPALPETARAAFAIIAERVERSLFALRQLSADDWSVARRAYAEFALAAPRALAA